MDEWPSHQQELTRKTAEHVAHLANLYQSNSIGVEAWEAALSAIWHVTSGLIDQDVSSLISELHREAMLDAARNRS